MGRPRDSGTFDHADVGRAIIAIRRDQLLGDRWPPRHIVAVRIPVTDAGLKARHLRLGLSWERYRELCIRSAYPGTGSAGGESAG